MGETMLRRLMRYMREITEITEIERDNEIIDVLDDHMPGKRGMLLRHRETTTS